MAGTMGQHNQLRYRGYVYDPETELYFLNSRFYDPEIGRFINADALTSTGGLLGNNMFAYCANSPVLLCDPNGTASMICLTSGFDDLSQPWKEKPGGGGSYYGRSSSVSHKPNLPEPKKLSFWEFIFNEDEQVVLDADYFAFYKGQLVILGDYPDSRSASFIIMFLDKDDKDPDTVKHEWGHYVQLRLMGPLHFLSSVAIPSITSDPNDSDYYSNPWERTADWLGGAANGPYKDGSLGWGIAHFILGPVVVPIYYLFN